MRLPPIHPAEWTIGVVLFGVIAAIAVAVHWTASPLAAGPGLQNATADGFPVVRWQSVRDLAGLRITSGTGVESIFPAGRGGNRREAHAAGLASGASYRYESLAVAPDGFRRPPAKGPARTAPPPGTPLSFLMFADSGSGQPAQYDLAQIMKRCPRDLVLHAGDLVYGRASPGGSVAKYFHLPRWTGGKSLQPERQGDRAQIAAFDDSQYSFIWVHVAAAPIVIEQIGADNAVLDRAVLEPPAAPA